MGFLDSLKEVVNRITKKKTADPIVGRMFKPKSAEDSLKPLPDTLIPLDDEDDEVEIIIQHGAMAELYDAAVSLGSTRKALYSLYDEMEQDTMIASTLEMFTDDATQYSMEMNATIWPEAGKYSEQIKDFFDYINIEDVIWGWAYNISKYGDFFVQVIGEEGVGVVRVVDDYHPQFVYRVEVAGKLSAFIIAMSRAKAYEDREQYICEPYHVVHFVNNYKPVFDQISLTYHKTNDEGKKEEVKRVITSTYGTSALYNTRQAFRNMKLMEKSLALSRLARAPQVRIFYINTEGMTPAERKAYVKTMKDKFKRRKVMDTDADFYDKKYNPWSFNDDMFIPYAGSKGDVRAETLGGDVDLKAMVDVDYFLNKLFSGLRVPKAFMGFEEALPGTIGAQTLTTLDIRYARMIKKIQRAIIQGIQRLCQIHLAYLYKKPPVLKEIKLGMVAISSAEENQKLEALERRFAIASTLQQMIRDFEGKVDSKVLLKYMFDNIIKLTGVDTDKLLNPPKPKAGEPGSPGYGTFGGEPGGGEGGGAFGVRDSIEASLQEVISMVNNGDIDSSTALSLINATLEAVKNSKERSVITTDDIKKQNKDLHALLPGEKK